MSRRNGRRPTNTMWIFCEGEKTEKNYFQKLKVQMRLSRFRVNVNDSTKKDAVGIVEYATNYKKANRGDFQDKDIIYCVFDRNGNSNKQLDKAKKIATKNGLEIIFSNPCFEYWILCHFEYFENRCDAKELISRISEMHIKSYKKADPEIYDKIEKNLDKALENSIRSVKKHSSNNSDLICCESNPCTNMYVLIEKFMKLKKQDEDRKVTY